MSGSFFTPTTGSPDDAPLGRKISARPIEPRGEVASPDRRLSRSSQAPPAEKHVIALGSFPATFRPPARWSPVPSLPPSHGQQSTALPRHAIQPAFPPSSPNPPVKDFIPPNERHLHLAPRGSKGNQVSPTARRASEASRPRRHPRREYLTTSGCEGKFVGLVPQLHSTVSTRNQAGVDSSTQPQVTPSPSYPVPSSRTPKPTNPAFAPARPGLGVPLDDVSCILLSACALLIVSSVLTSEADTSFALSTTTRSLPPGPGKYIARK